ncbi:MAG: prepilin-type N-terminal cleavage/methylation domain-containing protein [Deltaproteobacteria bacterium]|nr:MAG: prepilin-type N-terminal cleavage/methylation domain-containing protein [Deltaproteobacteria bacterium]
MTDAKGASGFTLLEVMISLAILAVSLVAILELNSGAVRTHNYAKHLTVATLLARSKMVDIEEALYAEETLPDFDKKEEGDFEAEGFPKFRWEAEIVKPDLDVDTDALMGLLAQGLGLDPEALGQEGGDLAGLLGGTAGGAGGSAASGLSSLIQGQVTQLVTMLEESVREVRLTVRWKDITGDSSLTVVTHVVRLQGQAAPGSEAQRRVNTTAEALRRARDANLIPGLGGRRSSGAAGGLRNIPALRGLQTRFEGVEP